MVDKIEFPGSGPPEIPEDAKSLGEAMGLASGLDLSSREQLNKINRLVREDGMDTHVSRVVVCALWIIALAALIMFLVLVAHKVKPDLWLTDDQLNSLQSFLFSGGLGAGITGLGKKYVTGEKSSK
ncbi:hypothetical protein ATY78_17190 [Rhizobium sp. R635]|uniref:hypothetical protein n=1 Tax=Rhizobium sp. R635 TaxID=1764275 RepID=UPI000B530F79|nr:hypothetical protein [Rhizobium sp. R635]OWV90215.1 hypothetical protein ATY78_17190 [Rhizobium sp. R635]